MPRTLICCSRTAARASSPSTSRRPCRTKAAHRKKRGERSKPGSQPGKAQIGLEERDLVVTAGDNVAFSTSLTHMTGAKTDGSEVSLWFRSTNGFRKENGRWKIVHAHSSVPFYMDGSSKACLDLKP
jgi:ketosteroid isomerase-like protein